ncbi:MAG: disulfide oxidoreductase [Candidatus Nanoarchaeia archaeon]
MFENLNLLGILTLLSQILIILCLLLYLTSRFFTSSKKLADKIKLFSGKHALLLGFIVSLVATLGSLYYSEIMGYDPCKLCWFQRILMYPQVLLFGIALWKKDHTIYRYTLPLSLLGLLTAAYHYRLQITTKIAKTVAESCSLTGPSCSDIPFTFAFYITIPLMAFTAFLLITLLMYQLKKHHI